MSEFKHIPIMLKEVLELLKPERGGIYADGTLGGGGHSEAILTALPDGGKLYGIDRDMDAINAASRRLEPFGDKFTAVHGNFFDMKELMHQRGVDKLDGILMDLGVSSYQLDAAERGFSYREDAPLDMRMDKSAAFSAYDVVNGYGSEQLFRIIKDYGEERYASRIANAIVKNRAEKPIATTLELADIIARSMPAAARREAQHPAKRTFQAIRIEVNNELGGLEKAIEDAHDLLAPGGVMADHGCDPSYTKTTDHTREYVPFLIYGKNLRHGVDLGTRYCFGTIANTVCDALDVKACLAGCSVWNEIKA